MNHNKHFYIIIGLLVVLILLPMTTLSFDAGSVPNSASGLSINDLVDVLFNFMWPIIFAILIIAFVIIGFLFFSAQGDPDKISKARIALLGAIIVTIMVLLAFSMPFIIRNTIGQGI